MNDIVNMDCEKQANHTHICGISLKEQIKIALHLESTKEWSKNNQVIWKNEMENASIIRTKNCTNFDCAFTAFERPVRIILNLLILNDFDKSKIQEYEIVYGKSNLLKTLIIEEVSSRFSGKLQTL